ncbi:hypothetical protein [Granulicella sp. S156]|jgi:hypothetical protein|uniref:hypothetical protein n=1 Tax=Granulicella sp. S156 TaxID=1747224 RepID=UPI00131E6CC4|nr:hypothetical protein [Granulicella sp. S156]
MMHAALVWFVLGASQVGVASAKPCPVVIGVAANGAIYEMSGGTPLRRSPAVLAGTVKIGCYPEGGPSPTSSVTMEIATGAPKQRVELVFDLLARSGWPRDKVAIRVWANAPHQPVRER